MKREKLLISLKVLKKGLVFLVAKIIKKIQKYVPKSNKSVLK